MSRSQRGIHDRQCLCCGIVLFIISSAIVAGLISLIVYFVRDGRPHVPQFTIVSFNLTALNVSSSSQQQVGGNWDARFQIKSRHFNIDYQDLESSVSYNGEVVSHTDILAFNQLAHNLTLIEVHYSALDALAGQRDAIVSSATMMALIGDLARGSVGFDVRVIAGKVRTSKSYEQLQALCGVVPVTVSEDGASGNFNGRPQKCKVKAYDLSTRYRP